MDTALIALVCTIFGAWLALAMRAAAERARGRARGERGKRGERNAERVLQAHGYRIVERQARVYYDVEIEGAPQQVALVLDFVVERGGERLIAEVKTGTAAQLHGRPETRRQLLEYQLATESDRVLLVDADAETITQVAFPLTQATRASRASTAWLAFAALAGLCVLYWWRLH